MTDKDVIDDARILARQKKKVTVTWPDLELPHNPRLKIIVNADGETSSKYGSTDGVHAEDNQTTIVIEQIVGQWIVRASGSTVYAAGEWSAVHDFTDYSPILDKMTNKYTVHLGDWRIAGTA